MSAIPLLTSNAGSSNKIFLDFDGALVTDGYWTDKNGFLPIHAPAYDIDGHDYDGSGTLQSDAFSEQEIANIVLAWRQMSEDFAPFDVDVTTIEPDASWFTTGGAEGQRALRVLFTSAYDDDGTGNVGAKWNSNSGEADPGSWYKTSDSPAFVFANGFDGSPISYWLHPETGGDWGPIQEYMGTIGSHEVGHALGLSHDGVSLATAIPAYHGNDAYYAGHTTNGDTDAPTSWRAIMGGSELRSLTQWSKGEYGGWRCRK